MSLWLVALTLGVLSSSMGLPCSWLHVKSWHTGFKAVLKVKMDETVDHWTVCVEFSQPVVGVEAWKGIITENSSTNYNVCISNKCYNNILYECQCLVLPFLVRTSAHWTGSMNFTLNEVQLSTCLEDPSMVDLTLNVTSLEAIVMSMLDTLDNLASKVEAITIKVDANTAKGDANAAAITGSGGWRGIMTQGKCDASTCTAIQATNTKLENCLADVSSSDCPSPASGKTGVVNMTSNTADIANKCDASKCSIIETNVTDFESCVADTSSSSCPAPTSGKISITGAINNLETPAVFMCQFDAGDFKTTGTLAPYGSCDINVGAIVDKTTGIFTVAKPGKYRLTFVALMTTSASKKVVALLVKTTGGVATNIARSLAQSKIGTAEEQVTITLDVILELAPADTIHVALSFHATGGKITGMSGLAQVIFSGQFIS